MCHRNSLLEECVCYGRCVQTVELIGTVFSACILTVTWLDDSVESPVTSAMICRANVIHDVSSYHMFLIGGYQFSVFLIDSSNTDILNSVYHSLIAGQTLLKCQYLLLCLEHHCQTLQIIWGHVSYI